MAAFRGFAGGTIVTNVSADAADTRDAHLIPGLAKSGKKETTVHSGTLAWEIPRTEEPGRLYSMGSQRIRHD